MRWRKRVEWGPHPLAADEWAVLQAEIVAEDLVAVDDAVEEMTGFMDPFREDVDGVPMVGVTDGQLAVVKRPVLDSRGRRALQLTFYAAGPVGEMKIDAYARLNSAAAALVDNLQAEGIAVESVRWTELPSVKRAF